MSLFNTARRRLRIADRKRTTKLGVEVCEARFLLAAQLFTVTLATDNGNNVSPTVGTLRWAIQQADIPANSGSIINFDITPGSVPFTINLTTTALLPVSEPTTIDGTTQPGYTGTPVIEVVGSAITTGSGLQLTANGSTIKGLDFVDFAGTGAAGIDVESSNNIVQSSYLGVETDGTTAGPNAQGILINGSNNTIGGAAAGSGNLIAFNTGAGVQVATGSGNAIRQNLIYSNLAGSDIVLASGTNSSQQAPANLAVTSVNNLTTIDFQVTTSIAGTGQYTADFFASTASGSPASQFLGTSTETITTAGTEGFTTSFSFAAALANGQTVTATVTGPDNSTSEFATSAALASPFEVTNTTDNVPGSEVGSLRLAIINANTSPPVSGTDDITFNIPSGPFVISPTTSLPTITVPVTVDGTSQPGYAPSNVPVVEISGTGLSGSPNGLTLGAGSDGSTIEGLEILGFGGSAIFIQSANNTIGGVAAGNILGSSGLAGIEISGPAAASNVVESNDIGTDSTGVTSLPNSYGVQIINSSNNTIGGTTAGEGNTIGFNSSLGIAVLSGNGNAIRQNQYNATNGPSTYVPGSDIALGPGANGGLAAPSLVSTSYTGTQLSLRVTASPIPLTLEVYLFGANDRVFQTTASLAANQTLVTVTVPGLANGDAIIATATDSSNDTSAFSNSATIASAFVVVNTNDSGSGSLRAAIINANSSPTTTITFAITPASASYVINLVTPLPTITASMTIDATSQPGFTNKPIVEVFGGNIGGSADGLLLAPGSDGSAIKGLDVAGFGGAGIHVESNNDAIIGNFLGTDTTGKAAGPGNVQGILIDTGTGNTIGGTVSTSANTIGFNSAGVVIESDGNFVLGNFIGTDALGDKLGNTFGVSILSSNNTIGGTASGSANTIGVSTTNIFIQAAETGNVVLGNFIGTDAAGDNLGLAGSYGVRVLGTGNTIGGAAAGSDNTIGFNNNGLSLEGASNQVLGNFVGTDSTGANQSNAIGIAISAANNTIGGNTIGFGTTAGVFITADDSLVVANFIGTDSAGDNLGNATGVSISASSNTIGGTVSGAGNTIGFSSSFGVSVVSGSNNGIQGNKYEGTTTAQPNPASDISLAPNANNGQVAPQLISASFTGGQLNVVLTLPDVSAGTSIDLYEDNSSSSPGQRIYLGSFTVSTVTSPLSGSITPLVSVGTGALIIATATVPANGTSPFSTTSFIAGPTVVTNTEDYSSSAMPIPGSLRYVISNAVAGSPPITFDITTGPFVISLVAPLPIDVPLTIDGTKQPGFSGTPIIVIKELTGSGNIDGLELAANSDGSTIEGLEILGFGGTGLVVESSNNTIGGTVGGAGSNYNIIGNNSIGISIGGATATSNSLLGNYIGVNPNDLKDNLGNTIGAMITSPNNTVGGTVSGAANIIGNNGNNVAGGSGAGVLISGPSAVANYVLGNYIGTNSAGNAVGNAAGVVIDGAFGNLVGGVAQTASGAPNLAANFIGFNSEAGISITGTVAGTISGNLVQGNLIGVDTSGDRLGNGTGVRIDGGASSNTIGPASMTFPASLIGSTSGGNITIGYLNSIAGNVISANDIIAAGTSGDGIEIMYPATNNVVVANTIGAFGIAPTGNAGNGILIQDASGNTIGGTTPTNMVTGAVGALSANANAIVGNAKNGILISISGTASVANTITGNWLSHNTANGVQLIGDLTGDQDLPEITDNFIGTTEDGTGAYTPQAASPQSEGNGLSGILLEETSTGKLMGSAAEISGNIVSGNGLSGVTIQSATPGSDLYVNAIVFGDIIGLDVTGTYAVNYNSVTGSVLPLGNVLDGVLVDNVEGVTVGGTTTPGTSAGAGNVISGNLGRGIEIRGNLITTKSSSTAVTVQDNFVGTDISGTKSGQGGNFYLGNLSDGIFLFIPPNTAMLDNLIANNRGSGIHVSTESSTGATTSLGVVTIQGNHIGTDFNEDDLYNGSDGIFIDGLTPSSGSSTAILANIQGNIISRNHANGIDVLQSSNVSIVGNTIGAIIDPSTNKPVGGNDSNGIFVNVSSGITIGGNTSGLGNVISGNLASGVLVTGNLNQGSGNFVEGNTIGLDATRTSAVPNDNTGVTINISEDNVIGVDPSTGIGLGNVISGNQLYGILVAGSSQQNNYSSGNAIGGNLIGTDPLGGKSIGNTSDGVFIINADGVTIGGSSTAANVISGNQGNGIQIFGSYSTGDLVQFNRIGVDVGGASPVGNLGNGVYLNSAGPNNTIGYGNVISGNGQSGVLIFGTGGQGGGNFVQGNFIGTDATGQLAVKNGGNGVFIFGTADNTIGGTLGGAIVSLPSSLILGGTSGGSAISNLISGNAQAGVFIFSPANTGAGAAVASGNVVAGNLIGTNAGGNAPLPNESDGVDIYSGQGNTIGEPGGWNVISGNRSDGVLIAKLSDADATGNVLDGNLIGTALGGTTALPFQQNGVVVENATNNSIGLAPVGTISGPIVPTTPSNVISGNIQSGIIFVGNSSSNFVLGDYIGVTSSGTGALTYPPSQSPQLYGVFVDNLGTAASNETIGGSTPGAGNIIAGSTSGYGVDIVGPAVSGTPGGNMVEGNLVGIDAGGSPVGNGIGIFLQNSAGNLIGGSSPAARNVISANSQAGIELSGLYATQNTIQGNYIGTDISGTQRPGGVAALSSAFPLQGYGVLIATPSPSSISSGVNNVVANNVISGNVVGIDITGQGSGLSGSGTAQGVPIGQDLVVGNKIGTDSTGMAPNPNLEYGVYIDNSASNTIGGVISGQTNVISANGIDGVEIFGGTTQSTGQSTKTDSASARNYVIDNIIGGNATAQADFKSGAAPIPTPDGPLVSLGTQLYGVVVIGSSSNIIGDRGEGNIISGNTSVGVYITRRDFVGNYYSVPTNNDLYSNRIDYNGMYGVLRYMAPQNSVAERPQRFANTFAGIQIPLADYIQSVNGNTSLKKAKSRSAGKRHSKPVHGAHKNPVKVEMPVHHKVTTVGRPKVPALLDPGAKTRVVKHVSSRRHH